MGLKMVELTSVAMTLKRKGHQYSGKRGFTFIQRQLWATQVAGAPPGARPKRVGLPTKGHRGNNQDKWQTCSVPTGEKGRKRVNDSPCCFLVKRMRRELDSTRDEWEKNSPPSNGKETHLLFCYPPYDGVYYYFYKSFVWIRVVCFLLVFFFHPFSFSQVWQNLSTR